MRLNGEAKDQFRLLEKADTISMLEVEDVKAAETDACFMLLGV
jgi:hypothetical protein